MHPTNRTKLPSPYRPQLAFFVLVGSNSKPARSGPVMAATPRTIER